VSAWRDAGLPLDTGADLERPENLDDARARVSTIPPGLLAAHLRASDATVICTGTSEEFARGHVPGAHWVPRGWLEPRIADVAPKDTPVVVTCGDGFGSTLAAATLLDLGYDASML